MSEIFKCNIYTKCCCFLKFLSAAAQNFCESPAPRAHPTDTAVQNESPTHSPVPLRCWERQSHRSSLVPQDPARATFLQDGLSTAHGTLGSCSGRPITYLASLLSPSLLLPRFPAWFCLQPPCHRTQPSRCAHQSPSTGDELHSVFILLPSSLWKLIGHLPL